MTTPSDGIEPLFVTHRFVVDLTVKADADREALADALLDYLAADEINGLPDAIRSVDGVEP